MAWTRLRDVPLAQVGTKGGLGKGIFTSEIEEALAAGRVGSRSALVERLQATGTSGWDSRLRLSQNEKTRATPSARGFILNIEDLPQHARVGTSSLRRQAQLTAIRPDLDIHPLRGNVDTRLRKLEQGEYDAIILAAAGLTRLGKTELMKKIIPAEIVCPAAGQGKGFPALKSWRLGRKTAP